MNLLVTYKIIGRISRRWQLVLSENTKMLANGKLKRFQTKLGYDIAFPATITTLPDSV